MVLLGLLIIRTDCCGPKKIKIYRIKMEKEEANNYLHKKIQDGEQVSPVLPEGVKNYLTTNSSWM